ncbi:alpha/beta hydrolase [Streptomyces sp. SID8499]|uniref:alpha/beta hydrolase n=1 Tax=Streptomyces sp. SID8499 TaxID=2706106 RepID=UPI0013C6E7E5|nr:alpha/beta hydrolase [Streptomyces sp. SID8499]NED32690.1 alpha/beta hydrolase [Streptomyces sp. SID8499]
MRLRRPPTPHHPSPTRTSITVRTTSRASLTAVGAVVASLMTLTPTTAVAASGAAAPDPLRRYTQQKLDWRPCDAKTAPAAFQCATLKVPLDYGDPGGEQLTIAVDRLRAGSAEDRRGVLLFNPGGPGAPGLDLPVALEAFLPREVKRRYDLVGFDPRGIGQSSPLSCGLSPDELNFDRPYHAETFAKDVRWARTVAAKCEAAAGRKLRHITTRDTARDMDVLRAALGERKISYYGGSYGTYLGAVYLQMFPRRADRFVLDSAVDPVRYGRGTFQEMAQGTEPAFVRWSRWTARRHTTYRLGTTPAEVRATFWDIVARADRAPVVTDGGTLTGDDIRSARDVFFQERKAADWVAGLKKAAEAAEPAAPAPDPELPPENTIAGLWAVMCGDTAAAWPRDPEQYRRDAVRDKARYPLYGDFASTVKPCAFWKPGSEAATEVDNDAEALILQNQWDPQTPLSAARSMHRALHGSRMVTVAGGEGHGVYGARSCADEVADDYLITGRLPAEDRTCPIVRP